MSKKLSTDTFEKDSRGLFKRDSRALPKIIVIVGPTASGKTDLAIKLAKKFNGEIVSADSRQIYRGLDIGTAKPVYDHANIKQIYANKSRIENKRFAKNWHTFAFYSHGIPHYLIDIKNPDEPYTVSQYKKDAICAIKKILAENKIPILVGGTGLYVKAVVDNLEIPKVKPNPKLRKRLENELKEKGLETLYRELIERDPEAAYIIDRRNPRRVIRALEIILATQKPFSAQRKQGKKLFNALKIGLNSQKEILKYRIDKRVHQMIRSGLIDETKKLIKKYPADLPAFDAIGYREIINYLEDKISLNEAITLIKRNTWRYAKRQITWFRKDKEIKWIRNDNQALNLAKNFLKN